MSVPKRCGIAAVPALACASLLFTACSSGDVSIADQPAATEPDEPVVVDSAPPTTAPPTTAAPTTVPPTTTVTTTEPCGSSCPLTSTAEEAVDAFFAAYNGDDWEALLATLGTSEPSWRFSPVQSQNAELMRHDFVWANALDQTTTPERCIDQYGTIRCDVEIEDDLHRLLAPYGFAPSRCTMTFEIAAGGLVPQSFSGFDCFTYYDGAMHVYGSWFEEHYPDMDPIQGAHYRAWNQTDESAAERAAAHLDEFDEAIAAYVAAGGDISDLRPGRL